MNRILLMCPHFMGYDERIVELLQRSMDVIYIDTEEILTGIREQYYGMDLLRRFFFKTFKSRRNLFREKLLSKGDKYYIKKLEQISEEKVDIVLVINGDGISNKMYERLRDMYPNAKCILYIWDDINALFKDTHLKYFDKIYSYNVEDCEKYGLIYLPMFIQKYDVEVHNNRKYDIAIIATANKERVRCFKDIYNKYKDCYNFFVYLYSPKEEYDFFSYKNALSFSDYMDVLANSRAVVEIVRCGQRGPTTRVFDALLTETKIITNNANIARYPVFNKNIYIMNKNLTIPKSFIEDRYEKNEYRPLFVNDWGNILLEGVLDDIIH